MIRLALNHQRYDQATLSFLTPTLTLTMILIRYVPGWAILWSLLWMASSK